MDTYPAPKAVDYQPNLNEILLSWKSPSHPYVKRSKVFYQTLAAFTLLLCIIAIFFSEYLLILVIISLAFVTYAISALPPVEVEHKVTPLGFENIGRMYKWMELATFWFEEKYGKKVLVVQTRLPFPPQIRAVIVPEAEEQVKNIMSRYLLYSKTPHKTWLDKVSEWLMDKIPLEASR